MRTLFHLAPLLTALLLAPAPALAQEAHEEALAQGEELRRQRDFKGAVKAYRKAHKLAPAAFECCFGLAESYRQLGDGEKAAASARAAVAAAPGTDERLQALNLLGLTLFGNGDAGRAELEEAADAFRQIVDEAPLGTARLNLGVTLLKLERDEEGISMLEAYLTDAPAGPETEMARAYVENPRRARENLVPPFTAVTLEGETLRPEDFAGKVVLIDFWGTWCAPCVQSIPHLQRLAKWSEKGPFALLSISNDEDGDALRRFVAEYEMSWPQIWDEDRSLTRDVFRIRHYPTFLIVDHEGVVVYQTSGWGGTIERDLDARVAGAIRLAKKAAKGR